MINKKKYLGMPIAVYILGFGIFSMTTSEFMVAGLMPALAAAFGVSITQVGYLIALYAAGMMIGGPLLSFALLRLPQKQALLVTVAIFIAGQVLGALAPDYATLAVARVITGVASATFFGVSISACATTVAEPLQGRAFAVVLGGLMVATVFGLPLATFIDQSFGWRASFWGVAGLVTVAGAAIVAVFPASVRSQGVRLATEMAVFGRRDLWAAYMTSGLIIGAVFAAFSYLSPILTVVSGFAPGTVPVLLMLYGAATVVGNNIVGRYANRHTLGIQAAGLISLAAVLGFFALFAENPFCAVAALIVLGLAGLPMNPTMAVRVVRAGGSGPLVSTVHTSVINFGIVAGSWVGGFGIDQGAGLLWPLWGGALLALIGLLSLVWYPVARRGAAAHGPADADASIAAARCSCSAL